LLKIKKVHFVHTVCLFIPYTSLNTHRLSRKAALTKWPLSGFGMFPLEKTAEVFCFFVYNLDLVTDRKKMEGSCSTGQSPQWALVPMEEEEV
jgi:hypothetical protein